MSEYDSKRVRYIEDLLVETAYKLDAAEQERDALQARVDDLEAELRHRPTVSKPVLFW